MRYFSDRESEEVRRIHEDISEDAWYGIRALIYARILDGSLGAIYRQNCSDTPMAIGTNHEAFRDAMRAQIGGLPDWPWAGDSEWGDSFEPSTHQILDMIEFCWSSIGKPIVQDHHLHGRHDHLRFDIAAGRALFRADIETIVRRNGIAYVLTEEGQIERLIHPVFHEVLGESEWDTNDSELDGLLAASTRKFRDPRPEIRKEGLQTLWDAWERIKTINGQMDKAAGAASMLDAAAGDNSPKFRAVLETEARKLSSIGNTLGIRHSETYQEVLARSEHLDYLFYRLFSLIRLILTFS